MVPGVEAVLAGHEHHGVDDAGGEEQPPLTVSGTGAEDERPHGGERDRDEPVVDVGQVGAEEEAADHQHGDEPGEGLGEERPPPGDTGACIRACVGVDIRAGLGARGRHRRRRRPGDGGHPPTTAARAPADRSALPMKPAAPLRRIRVP